MTDPSYRFLLPRVITGYGRIDEAAMRRDLVQSFVGTCHAMGIDESEKVHAVIADLLTRWSEPHRKYHTVAHLYTCISAITAYRRALYGDTHTSTKLDDAEMALWFHDAVYVIHAKHRENEKASASLAASVMEALGIHQCRRDPVVQGILSTVYGDKLCHLDIPPEFHDTCEIVRSCDLASLGSVPSVFDAESALVFEEYNIPSPYSHDLKVIKKRAMAEIRRSHFLYRILETKPYNPWFHGLCYAQAFENVSRAMSRALDLAMSNGVIEFAFE